MNQELRIKRQDLRGTNTLFIDTSHNAKTVIGLTVDGKEFMETHEITERKSQEILLLVDNLLRKHHLKAEDLTEIHVCVGPGSFTGLRVGIAVAQALSTWLQIPINGNPPGTQIEPTYV